MGYLLTKVLEEPAKTIRFQGHSQAPANSLTKKEKEICFEKWMNNLKVNDQTGECRQILVPRMTKQQVCRSHFHFCVMSDAGINSSDLKGVGWRICIKLCLSHGDCDNFAHDYYHSQKIRAQQHHRREQVMRVKRFMWSNSKKKKNIIIWVNIVMTPVNCPRLTFYSNV